MVEKRKLELAHWRQGWTDLEGQSPMRNLSHHPAASSLVLMLHLELLLELPLKQLLPEAWALELARRSRLEVALKSPAPGWQ